MGSILNLSKYTITEQPISKDENNSKKAGEEMKKLLFVIFISLFLLASCKNLEKDIIGTWETHGECDPIIDEEMIYFNDDGTIEGVEGYSEYKVKKHDKKDYVILKSPYDSKRMNVKLDEEKMSIKIEGSAFECTVDRVDE